MAVGIMVKAEGAQGFLALKQRYIVGGGEMGASMESRWYVYTEGLQYFMKSPIWGNNAKAYGGVDIWHSTVIEYMVKSGLIGVTIWFTLFKKATKKTLILKEKSTKLEFAFWQI